MNVLRHVAAGTVLATLSVLGACSGEDAGQPATEAVAGSEASTFEYTIPLGAGKALDAGTPLEILPAELDVRVGDTISIVNDDERGHTVGPFFVGANETLSQRFSSPGEFVGVCTVHPSGELILVVKA